MSLAACQQATPVAPVIGAVAYGQTVQGTLSSAENHWLFIAKANDVITLEFSTTGAPPSIVILDPEGSSIARLTTTGQLDKFRLLIDGTYTIVIGTGTGDYGLHLIKEDSSSATLPPATTEAGKILHAGDSRLSTLKSADMPDLWEFDGQSDAVISIRMASSLFDSALRLYTPDGLPLVEDDNSGGGYNALISGIKLPATGMYHIQAGSKNGSGEYTLSVIEGAVPTLTPQPPTSTPDPNVTAIPTALPFADEGMHLRIGQSVEGLIANPVDKDRLALFAPAGSILSIGMFVLGEDKLVPSFEMFAPNGKSVARISGANGAILPGFKAPVTGAYILYPYGEDRSYGHYILSVGDGYSLRDLKAGKLTADVLSQNKLVRTGDRDLWSWELPANATIFVEVKSLQSDFEPLVDIVNPNGSLLTAVQANPTTRIARTNSVITPVQGTYQVRVTAAAGQSGGRYTIKPNIVQIIPTATFSLRIDQTIEGTVQHDQRYTYTFKAVPGVLLQADVQGKQQFDPVLELYGPSGRRLAASDDTSVDNAQAYIQIGLDDGAGDYHLEVYGYAMTPGSFTMSVKVD